MSRIETFHLGAASVTGPHADQPVLRAGPPPDRARLVVLLVHGRGGTAVDVLGLRDAWAVDDVAYIAPQAAAATWYPDRFIAPLERNEPHLSSGLALLGAITDHVERIGVPADRHVLLGFSQGGCLALEYAGRDARRRAGVVGLSAGLIGPPGHRWRFSGSLAGSPVLLGCSAHDPHIPVERVEETAAELRRIGGAVDARIYPGSAHLVRREDLERVGLLLGVDSRD